MAECAHVDQIKVDVPENVEGCEECLATGGTWVDAKGVPRVRPRWLLRLVAGHARDQALPGDRARDHELGDAGRFLVLVLHRRGVVLTVGRRRRSAARTAADRLGCLPGLAQPFPANASMSRTESSAGARRRPS